MSDLVVELLILNVVFGVLGGLMMWMLRKNL